MKQLHTLIALPMLLVAVSVYAEFIPSNASPYIGARSQSVAAARELVGWQWQINRSDMTHDYGSFTMTPEFTQTFKAGEISQSIFGPDLVNSRFPVDPPVDDCNKDCLPQCQKVVVVSGRDIADRGSQDWLADYLGLPTDFQSILSFNPQIRNLNIDFDAYFGFDSWAPGFYFRIHAPLTWTKWQLNMSEEVIAEGDNNHSFGYFSDDAVPRENLLSTATAFLSGCQAPTIPSDTDVDAEYAIGGPIVFQKLQFSKMWAPCVEECPFDKVALSDIEMALGYNFARGDDYHVGFTLRASAPTGNQPKAIYLFEPIIGSGKHWKLGVGVTTHYIFWNNEARGSHMGFWLDANVQHLFAAQQVRSFDLANKPNSRYALAQKLGTYRNEDTFHLSGDSDSGYEWQNEFAPVANLTTSTVSVKVKVEGNVVGKIAYQSRDGYQFDLGVEFWGRSCECIRPQSSCPPAIIREQNAWALKGDAFVVGFEDDGGDAALDRPIRLSATQSGADMHHGTNNFPDGMGNIAPTRNPGIDNPVLATDDNAGADVLDAVTDGQTNSSVPVVFITQNMIGYGNASTKGLSLKVFGHFSHTWYDVEHTPFIGIGGSAEFAHRGLIDDNCCGTSTGLCQAGCNDNTLNQWAVWIKGGISFE